jgi:hypothetical protein
MNQQPILVPVVNGERRCSRDALAGFYPPRHVYLQDNGDVVVYYDGDVFPDVIEPPAIPMAVTRVQFRLALSALGLLAEVEQAIASSPSSVQIEYADRQVFERSYPLILSMAAALGKTDAEIDAVFELAATL